MSTQIPDSNYTTATNSTIPITLILPTIPLFQRGGSEADGVLKTATYKPTNIPWLGDIPSDWEVRRLGKLWKYCNRGQTPDYSENENDLCVINQSCVTYDGIKLSKAKFDKSSDYDTSKGRIEKGDILFNSTGTGTLGRVCLFDLDLKCICDSHVTILRVNPYFVLAKFLNYFFKDQQDFVVSLLSEGATNQIELRSDWLKSLQIPLPPLQTQTAIATYLDTKCELIAKYISDKTKIISLLQEQKKSLIYNAVTGKTTIPLFQRGGSRRLTGYFQRGGSGADGVLKPSGVEWLGDIPSDWVCTYLKRFSNIYSGGTPSKDKPEYWTNGTIPWLASGEVNQGIINYATDHITELGLNNSSAKWIESGSLVIALAGQGKTKGTVALVNIKTTCNQSLGVIKPNNLLNNKYLYFLLDSAYRELRGIAGDGLRDGLNLQVIGEFKILIPSLSTQQQIVAYLDTQNAIIDDTIGKIQREIELILEYKKSLIYNAVTGKILI